MKKLLNLTLSFSAVAVALLSSATQALAEDAAMAATGGTSWQGAAVRIGLGIAAAGGALGQGKLVASVVESIGRNPGASGAMFVPMILGIAFIESLVLFVFLLAFM